MNFIKKIYKKFFNKKNNHDGDILIEKKVIKECYQEDLINELLNEGFNLSEINNLSDDDFIRTKEKKKKESNIVTYFDENKSLQSLNFNPFEHCNTVTFSDNHSYNKKVIDCIVSVNNRGLIPIVSIDTSDDPIKILNNLSIHNSFKISLLTRFKGIKIDLIKDNISNIDYSLRNIRLEITGLLDLVKLGVINKEFFNKLEIMTGISLLDAGDNGYSTFTALEPVNFRVVTKRYSGNLEVYDGICNSHDKIYLEVDLMKREREQGKTLDGYVGVDPNITFNNTSFLLICFDICDNLKTPYVTYMPPCSYQLQPHSLIDIGLMY